MIQGRYLQLVSWVLHQLIFCIKVLRCFLSPPLACDYIIQLFTLALAMLNYYVRFLLRVDVTDLSWRELNTQWSLQSPSQLLSLKFWGSDTLSVDSAIGIFLSPLPPSFTACQKYHGQQRK